MQPVGRYEDLTLREFLDAVSARTPAPGAGAAAAVTVSVAAGLVAMAGAYSADVPDGSADRARWLQARALALADEDAAAYTAVLETGSSGDEEERRNAWQRAIAVPLEVAECGAQVAADGAWFAEHGRASVRGDALTGVVLAQGAVRAAAGLVVLNVAAAGSGEEEAARAQALADDAAACVRRVTSAPEET